MSSPGYVASSAASSAGSVLSSAASVDLREMLLSHANLGDLSLTYALTSIAIRNQIHYFHPVELQKGRRFLGEGTTCTVYQTSITPELDNIKPQAVAVKQKRRKGSWFDHEISLGAWLRSCYQDVRIMSDSALKSSKNVAQVLGFFWEKVDIDGPTRLSPCLVMPLATVDTVTLDHFFHRLTAKGENASLERKMQFCCDVVNGVYELHRCGVAHGDLKLGNVLLFEDDNTGSPSLIAKISDFSHATVVSDYEKALGHPLRYTGTRPFIIPEVRRDDAAYFGDSNDYEPSIAASDYLLCDIFGLGLLLVAILSNGVDFASAIKHREEARHSRTVDDSELERELDKICAESNGVLALSRALVFENNDSDEAQIRSTIHACLEACLQDDPSKRSAASSVLSLLTHMSTTGTNDETISNPDEEPYGKVETGHFSPQELAILLVRSYLPPLPDLLQSQIFAELARNSNSPSSLAPAFLANCFTSGFGTAADLKSASGCLLEAADRNDRGCRAIWQATFLAVFPDRKELLREYMKRSYISFSDSDVDLMEPRSANYARRIQHYKLVDFHDVSKIFISSGQRDIPVYSRTSAIDAEKNRILVLKRKETISLICQIPSIPSGYRREETLQALLNKLETLQALLNKLQKVTLEVQPHSSILESAAKRFDPLETFSESFLRSMVQYNNTHLETESDYHDSFSLVQTYRDNETEIGLPFGLLDTALHMVAENNSPLGQRKALHNVMAVIQAGGSREINEPNLWGETPLIQSCRYGQFLVARYLLELGADPCRPDNNGVTALHWLSLFREDEVDEICKLLIKSGSNIDAITSGAIEIESHCLFLHAHSTPLHYAAMLRNVTAVKALLALGADPFAVTKVGVCKHSYHLTPLHLAVSCHFYNIVEELIKVKNTIAAVTAFLGRKTSQQIHMIHLVGFGTVGHLLMAPFARWVMHGVEYKDALDRTLSAILSVFPERHVLEPILDAYPFLAIPASDPWIFQSILQAGFSPKQPSREELGPFDRADAHQHPGWEAELLIRAAVDGSGFGKYNSETMDAVLDFVDTTTPSFGLVMAAVDHCVKGDMPGPLSVMLRRLEVLQQTAMLKGILFTAAEHDSVAVIDLVFSRLTDLGVNAKEIAQLQTRADDQSVLHLAARSNATHAVTYLLDHGADIDLDIQPTGTALNVAAGNFENRDAVVLLLQRGANIFCSLHRGSMHSILHIADSDFDSQESAQQFSLVQVLLETFPDKFVKDGGPTINAQDRYGRTALHYAAMRGHLNAVRALVALPHIEVSVKEIEGWTPLMWALHSVHFSDESLLLAETDHRSKRNRCKTICKILIDANSAVPEVEPHTGDYLFLLQWGMNRLLRLVSGAPATSLTQYASTVFRNFNFVKANTVMLFATDRKKHVSFSSIHSFYPTRFHC
ncbi:hypothetical protein ASPCAL03739 [Aspergillus calidoustus]|uniref:Protein kinase domain-containing protein n=1 Tax=Aspergillus calidoustus TaxID=454130 RepID=A0A0U5FT34_ASPCI|nr:hypothetical protein ASPCAL03739 [Aspergillus calidoustus]